MSELGRFHAAIVPLMASVGILVLGNGLLATLAAVRLDLEQVAVATIGLIMAAYSVGFVIGTIVAPHVIERAGHVRAFAACAAVAAAAALMHAMMVEPVTWVLLRAVSGLTAAALFTIVESWLNAGTGNTARGRVLSVYMTVTYLTHGTSQFLFTQLDPLDFRAFSVVAILVALSLVPLALARVEGPAPTGAGRLGLIRLTRISPLGVAGCFAAGLICGAFAALGPIYARGIGASTGWIGHFMMTAILAGFVLQFPMGHLSDRFDRRTVFLGVAAGIGMVSVMLAVVEDPGVTVFVALLCIFGGLAFSIYPIALAHANDFMQSQERVPASAGLLLVFGAGAVAGPVIAAEIMAVLGNAGLFAFFGSVGGMLAVFTLYRMSVRQALPLDEQGAFVAVPQTTPLALELSPRADSASGLLPYCIQDGANSAGNGEDRRIPATPQ